MSSPAHRPAPDSTERELAIDPRESFLVQAPAGSGKTELLIQRFLRLLSQVEHPEAIVAITFTRKAAGEMVRRIMEALRAAQQQTPIHKSHERFTRTLAEAALLRDRELGWNLLEHPARLRVQTIDSLCVAVASEMPWLARLGAMPGIEEKAQDLYRKAARRTVLLAGDSDQGAAVSYLLQHLDNDAARARNLIADMLGAREQWIRLSVNVEESAREPLEEALRLLIVSRCRTANELVPEELRDTWVYLARYSGRDIENWPGTANPNDWKRLLEFILTGAGDWRKQLTAREGFPAKDSARKKEGLALIDSLKQVPGMLDALVAVRETPPLHYSDRQWQATLALLGSLKLAVAQLEMVFREEGATDFAEIGIAARHALGDANEATDLAFRWDSRIQHLLVDEFQDTSRGQMELIEQLTANWMPDDGRTLFLVGDPMQSIYRFRQAEVGIFLRTRARGIGHLRPKSLNLISNYRSHAGIVDRVNQIFRQLFPQQEDATIGAARFFPSEAQAPAGEGGVTIHGFTSGEDQREAERIVELIRAAQTRAPGETVAVLVRARTHLPWAVKALKAAKLAYQAVEIDPLAERTVVLDLLALTRAMLHRADRIAWLATLRAPWCGLGLADLEKLATSKLYVWDALQDLDALSEDGRNRAARLRDIFDAAFEQEGRWPLRRWVEHVWIKLGGPACLDGDERAFGDACAYLDHLESRQSGSDLADAQQFEAGLKELFAKPDPGATDRLQIMTIHKAKGLEFDTVIVAGLGRSEKNDDSQLVLFHGWDEENAVESLLAPIPAPGDDDPLYNYLRKLENQKSKLERIRLLYVAATRAKKSLHLLGQAAAKAIGELSPGGRSMLSDLWKALTDEERTRFARQDINSASSEAMQTSPLRRLPLSWTPPPLPANLSTGIGIGEPHEPTFEWVGESLRIAGTVVHEFLRRVRDRNIDIPPTATLRRLMMHAGVTPSEIGFTLTRVTDALRRMQASERARWILADHRDARVEYAISGVKDGEIVRGKVDRTFIDESGIRWIIDFKTSVHEGGALETFLDEQQRRYGDQLARYARLLAPLGQPVRVGLYFPLLDQWREWIP